MKIETVKIEADEGYVIINKSDFDPKKHTLYGEKKPVKPVYKRNGK